MKKTPKKPTKEYPILDAIARSATARETVLAYLRTDSVARWRTATICPPESCLDRLNDTFRLHTSLPLELPFFVFLHYMAADMLRQGCHLLLDGQRIDPSLWSVILAPQGCLKSITADWIGEGIRLAGGDIPMFGEPVGPKQFFEEMKLNNRTLWLRDEFGKFVQMLDTQAYMYPMKDLLLKTTNGAALVRGGERIENPALVILGLSVTETFGDCVSVDSLLDGFISRFGLVITCARQDKSPAHHHRYEKNTILEQIKDAWLKVRSVPCRPVYRISAEAEEAYAYSFRQLWDEQGEKQSLPEGFFRRILWRGLSYAMLYQRLLCIDSAEIGVIPMHWAGRLCALQLVDAKMMLEQHGLNDVARLVAKVRTFVERKPKATPRDVTLGVWGVKNIAHAAELMSLL